MASKAQKLILGLLCLLLFLEPSSQQDTLVQGQEIKCGIELVSRGQGNFILGFFSLTRNNYYLGIWYNDNSATLRENLVWVANRDIPIFNNSGSLTIDGYGNLKISYNGGLSIVLYSGQEVSNTSAVLLDTGNFVVLEQGSERQLWQSFDYPTDTLLPGMKLGVNWRTGHTWYLRSWSGAKVPEVGSFTFGLDPNHTNRLVILWHGNLYWTNEPWNNSDFELSYSRYDFSYVSNENETYLYYSVNEDITTTPRLTIDYLGKLNDSSETLVHCSPSINVPIYLDINSGCAVKKLPECKGPDSNLYIFPVLLGNSSNGFKFNESDSLTIVDCQAKCLNNCSCIAYASINEDGGAGCEIWSTWPNGPNQTSSTPLFSQKVYHLKSPNYIQANSANANYSQAKSANVDYSQAKSAKWWRKWLVVAMAVGGFIITFLCFLCYTKWKKHTAEGEREKKQKMLIQELGGNARPSPVHDKVQKQNKDEQANHELQIFSFESISVATSNFSSENKLGEGGFGLVYKGKLPNEQEIAIKRLSRNSGQGLVEFKNEAILIAKLQHTNLVRLFGFCVQEEEKILIYEYMPNKSLDFFLFDSTKKHLLNWKKRFNIIEGIAQGLVYLHKYSRLRVIHRDLKASNILLDEELNPKISDFGMARIFGLKGSEEKTNRIVGTYGYMSPEYAMNGVVSIKMDVFSFGVLQLEIVSGKKNNSRYQSNDLLNLIGYAWQLWNEGKGLELIDPAILDKSCPTSEVLRCLHVGLLCVQDQATDRPTMLDVISMLSNETLQLSPPKQPAFFINTIVRELEDSMIESKNCSLNDVTISEMEAR